MRPGVDVFTVATAPPRTASTDTGVAFMVGDTADNPSVDTGSPVGAVQSMGEYEAMFGARGTGLGQASYDAADAYFHEGGTRLYVSPTNPGALGTQAAKKNGKSDPEAETQILAPTLQPALDLLTKDLGPGQVFLADPLIAADAANQAALLQHCLVTNRVALLSTADSDVAQDLMSAAGSLQADPNARLGQLLAPSAVIPGVAIGTTRTVPYSAIQAGIIARNDALFTANQPAAGDLGQAVYAVDLANRYTDQDYENLNIGSVTMARVIYGGVRTYGARSVVDPTDLQAAQWLLFNWSRLNMQITAQAEAIAEHYVFAQIDGQGKLIAQFGGDLSAMLAGFYDAGALYGATPAEAFEVNVGSQVNTPTTIANAELHAVLKVKMAPAAEWVVIEIVKVATTDTLAPLAAVAA